MYNNIKHGVEPIPFIKQGKSTDNNIIQRSVSNGDAFVFPKDLDASHKYLGYMGDLALAGIGAGMSWHALKKVVEHTYRKRLEKAVRNSTGVADFYNSRTAPITNQYVGALKEGSLQKTGLFNDYGISKGQADHTRSLKHVNQYPKGTELLSIPRGQGFINDIATRMAENPLVYNTLAFVSLPAIFAGSVWAGNSLSKAINDKFKTKDIRRMTKEREEARKRYEDAALTLRNITLGGMTKESAAMEKRALPIAAILALGGLGLLGTGGIGAIIAGQRRDPGNPVAHVPNPYPTQNSVANGMIRAGIGALGLAALPASYQFVQSMRKGYKNQVEGISDVTRAAQAWNAVRDSRGEDFATLRASLADEPDLLDFESHGTKKKRKS